VGAGRALIREGLVRRVAVIDLDAHQGDGTLALVRDDEAFGVFDISGSDWGCRPEGATLACHMARNAAEYFAALDELGAFLDVFEPDLAEYQAGVDCYERDSLGAVEGLTAGLLAERDRLVLRDLSPRGRANSGQPGGRVRPGRHRAPARRDDTGDGSRMRTAVEPSAQLAA